MDPDTAEGHRLALLYIPEVDRLITMYEIHNSHTPTHIPMCLSSSSLI